jgi:hypothetical protein
MPLGRDHTSVVAVGGAIHMVGGRVDSFHTNSNLHHAHDPRTDHWTMRAPIPTARSGHGCVWHRDRIFCVGGEGTNRVYGQNEAYDPAADRWAAHAPMLTPRHGRGGDRGRHPRRGRRSANGRRRGERRERGFHPGLTHRGVPAPSR